MRPLKTPWLSSTLITLCLIVHLSTFSQGKPAPTISDYPIDGWVKQLELNKSEDVYTTLVEIAKKLLWTDSLITNNVIKELRQRGAKDSHRYNAQLAALQAFIIMHRSEVREADKIRLWLDKMMEEAYLENDPALLHSAQWIYGSMMYTSQDLEYAYAYASQAVESYELPNKYGSLHYNSIIYGEILYHTRDYRKCIEYSLKGIPNMPEEDKVNIFLKGKCLNTIGQAYYQLGIPDSAMYYYQQSLSKFSEKVHPIWVAINYCFIGQLNFDRGRLQEAKKELHFSFSQTINQENTIAGRAAVWLARIHLKEKQLDSADYYLEQSIILLNSLWPKRLLQEKNYLQDAYFTWAEYHQARNQSDSVFHYLKQYTRLHDSLERVAVLSGNKIAKLRIASEQNHYAVQTLMINKRATEQKRNWMVVGISLLLITLVILLDREKKLARYQQQLAAAQKEALEMEAITARQQLDQFTRNLVEKTSLLEQVEKKLKENQQLQEQEKMLEQLTSQTILTEEDWLRFKRLFDKMNPSFFTNLKEKAEDISVAEQRMAALIHLKLTSRQMAAILGISVDSVHKNRQRLRQRLQQPADVNLGDYLKRLS
ncbi:hypothetical protein [Flavihumibacter sp. ZG627]|uniref:hypothetical protein n=1 Tax=Flavihumibacter sp. ZG627 TaxID=1463156 RepID=UPI000580145A|nr:hypothetical protein [Flavihumibacter sp. ZG627]KIC92103.1 hypothetical protein HY58_00605 [Flavihumibacter sp. ZG627]